MGEVPQPRAPQPPVAAPQQEMAAPVPRMPAAVLPRMAEPRPQAVAVAGHPGAGDGRHVAPPGDNNNVNKCISEKYWCVLPHSIPAIRQRIAPD